jgi:K+-transporting ATPase KdpF subunit
MSGWDLLAALLAVALLIYLVAVLLRPEDFS